MTTGLRPRPRSIPPIAAYELPRSVGPVVPQWEVDPARAVLLVHDMQRFFLDPLDPALRQRLVGNVAAVLTAYRTQAPVAYTAQPGSMTTDQRGLLADLWGPGMSRTEDQREVEPAVRPRPGDWLLTKWRYSAFQRTDLLERMRAAGRDQLVITGVYAHVGILTTALEAYSHDIETFVVADATADFDLEHHERALRHAGETCAVVTTTEALLR